MLQTDRDHQVVIDSKKHIENKLKKGDDFKYTTVQLLFKTGYNLAYRVMKVLEDDGYVKEGEKPYTPHKIIFNL